MQPYLERKLHFAVTVVQRLSVKNCPEKFRKLDSKTPDLESLFNTVAGRQLSTLLKKQTPI